MRKRKEELINKTLAAVKERLTKEISYWDHRAVTLKAQERRARTNARLNSARPASGPTSCTRASRTDDANWSRNASSRPCRPSLIGGGAGGPCGPARPARWASGRNDADAFARETARVEQVAMQAVMAPNSGWATMPRDVSARRCGYDMESSIPGTGQAALHRGQGAASKSQNRHRHQE